MRTPHIVYATTSEFKTTISLAGCYDVVVYIVFYIVVMEVPRHRSGCTTASHGHIVCHIGVNYDFVYLYRGLYMHRVRYRSYDVGCDNKGHYTCTTRTFYYCSRPLPWQ